MAGVLGSGSLSGLAERLAGVPAGDKVDGFEFGSGELFDVAVLRDFRPVPREDLPAVFVDFDLPAAGESGAVESKVNSSDSGTKGAVRHGRLRNLRVPVFQEGTRRSMLTLVPLNRFVSIQSPKHPELFTHSVVCKFPGSMMTST